MQGRRGGRVQVNALQFMELEERVAKLEALLIDTNTEVEGNDSLTREDIMEILDKQHISYRKKDTRDVLLGLLNQGDTQCQKELTE